LFWVWGGSHVAEILLSEPDSLVVFGANKSHDHAVWSVEAVTVFLYRFSIDHVKTVFGTESGVPKGVVSVGSHVEELGTDEVGFGPYLVDFIASNVELGGNLFICDSRISNGFCDESQGVWDGVVEGSGLIHDGFSGTGALDAAAELLCGFVHLFQGFILGRFEGESIHDVTASSKRIILETGSGLNVHSHA
jgi:hypothetical protein